MDGRWPVVPLRRALSLAQLTLYGLGTILGAGIYALIGEIAGEAGMYAPIAFLLAVLIAGFTALSYAELAARFPRSAGEAAYVQEGFSRAWLSRAVGWSVALMGVVSAATVARACVGYLHIFVDLPDWMVICSLVLGLGAITLWGIRESVGIASALTVVEVLGLVMVLVAGGDSLAELPGRWEEMLPPLHGGPWTGIVLGAYLAFYAFIGFEDIVNVAEEAKNPTRNVPMAILLSLGVTTILYVSVSLVAVLSLPIETLAKSEAPLAAIIVEKAGWSPAGIGLISLVAIMNGALIQMVMASRVIYGMSRQDVAPRIFSIVHPRTRTPLAASLVVTSGVLLLALWFPVVTLAEATSTIVLVVFALVNLSLVRVRLREKRAGGPPGYPVAAAITGFLLCVAFLIMGSGLTF